MAKTQTENGTKSSKRQTQILIGIALIILSAVFVFVALEQPKVTEIKEDSSYDYNYSYEGSSDAQTTNSSVNNSSQQDGFSTESAVRYPLNLNTCTAEELMTIKGIGESRADAIISYRDYIGGYTSVEQLKNISGIGESVYAAIEPYVTV